jgi:putative phosphoesterase
MRIAVFGDVHGNIFALNAVLTQIDAIKPDKVVCVGDLVGYGPFPNEVIETIRSRGIITIQGNYDEGVGLDLMACGCDYKDQKAMEMGAASLYWTQDNTRSENKSWLSSLPVDYIAEWEGVTVRFTHGSPRANNEYLFEGSEALLQVMDSIKESVLVCGHTHLPYHQMINGKQIINSGSIGKPKHGNPNATWIYAEISNGRWSVKIMETAYDAESMAKAIEASTLPHGFADMIRSGKG